MTFSAFTAGLQILVGITFGLVGSYCLGHATSDSFRGRPIGSASFGYIVGCFVLIGVGFALIFTVGVRS